MPSNFLTFFFSCVCEYVERMYELTNRLAIRLSRKAETHTLCEGENKTKSTREKRTKTTIYLFQNKLNLNVCWPKVTNNTLTHTAFAWSLPLLNIHFRLFDDVLPVRRKEKKKNPINDFEESFLNWIWIFIFGWCASPSTFRY